MRSTDVKVLVTILGNIDGIIPGLDIGTQLGSLDGSFDFSNDGNIQVLLLGGSLGSTDGKVLGYDEFIKLVYTDGKLFSTILEILDRIILGLDIVTELDPLDGSCGGSNDGNIGGLLLGDLMGSNDGKVLGSDQGIKLISNDGKLFILVSNMQIPLAPATQQLHLP